MRRLPILAAMAGLLLALLPAAPAASVGTAQSEATRSGAAVVRAYTHAQLVKRGKTLEFSYSLAHFMKVYRAKKTGIDTKFTWKNFDGCSSTPKGWADFFRNSCLRHDFGYRNFGHGLNLGYSEADKAKIDGQLSDDLRTQCYNKDRSNSCYAAATVIYNAVRLSGKSYTAFYAHTCPASHFCLFDDHGYADRRKALTVSHKDLKTLDFGDKASSLKNYTTVSWVIYDDDHYGDRRFCVRPGAKVSDLGAAAYKFSDKTSSVKRLGSSACPKGTPVIG